MECHISHCPSTHQRPIGQLAELEARREASVITLSFHKQELMKRAAGGLTKCHLTPGLISPQMPHLCPLMKTKLTLSSRLIEERRCCLIQKRRRNPQRQEGLINQDFFLKYLNTLDVTFDEEDDEMVSMSSKKIMKNYNPALKTSHSAARALKKSKFRGQDLAILGK